MTDRLVEDGVRLFSEAFDTLLAAVDKGRRSELTSMLDQQCYGEPGLALVRSTIRGIENKEDG